MAQTACGFDDKSGVSGSNLLAHFGPTLFVNIGFDPKFKLDKPHVPKAGIKGVSALVDTGASTSCIDNILAAELKLPIIDRRQISGSNGNHTANMYLAQIYIPSLNFTIYGSFAGVNLKAGGQDHNALIGRTFLQHFTMVYEGKSGSVTLSN